MRASSSERGATLVELIVVLALLAILAGVVGLSIRRAPEIPQAGDIQAMVADARRTAIRSGRSVTRLLSIDGRAIAVTAHPDGVVIADPGVAVDRLTGEAVRDSL
ncbi:MAG: pilus assembly FimT family protein [Gemmatimonadaceae bacterium]